MTFYEVLPALKEGKKIRKTGWKKDHYISRGRDIIYRSRITWQDGRDYLFGIFDFENDDWEIIPGPVLKKVKLRDLTEEQYSSRCKNHCDWHCKDCRFKTVTCNYESARCWVDNKEVYSDKFLDQEIEVEE